MSTASLAAKSASVAVQKSIEAFHDAALMASTISASLYLETLDPVSGREAARAFAESQSMSRDRYMVLVDDDGSIVFAPPFGTAQPAVEAVLNGVHGFQRYTTTAPDGSPAHMHTYSARLESWGIHVVAVESDDDFIVRVPPDTVARALSATAAGTASATALFLDDATLLSTVGDWQGRAPEEVPGANDDSGTVLLVERSFGSVARYVAFEPVAELGATVAVLFDADYLEVFAGRLAVILGATLTLTLLAIVLISHLSARLITAPIIRATERLIGPDGHSSIRDELTRLVRRLLRYSVRGEYERQKRERAEDDLAVSMSVFRNSNEGIITLNPDGTIDRVNAAFLSITGYERESVLGRHLRQFLSEEHVEEYNGFILDQVAEEDEWSGETAITSADGSPIPILLSLRVVRSRDGLPRHFIGVARDISDIKSTKDRLEHLATHDALTGLPNRTVLSEALEREVETRRRHGGKSAVLFVDIDHFKDVNDTHGHHAGDELLRSVASRLKGTIRSEDMIARFGGDEFVVVISDFGAHSVVDEVVRRMLNSVREPAVVEGITVRPSATAGIAIFPDSGATTEDLLKNADAAMYQAKRIGRGSYQYHDPQTNESVRMRLAVQDRVRFSLRTGEFVLLWQPVVRLSDLGIASAEALIRLKKGDKLKSPATFLPQIEGSQISVELANWVLNNTIETIAAHDGGLPDGFRVAVNVSATEILQRDFVPVVLETLERHGVSANRLAVEVTEGAAIKDIPTAQSVIRGLRRLGVRVYLDDFGTGYSSLQYLRELGVDAVKLDKSFLNEVPASEASCSLVRGVVDMAHGLGLKTMVEGVEREDQLDYLRSLECDYVQGYHTGHPISVDAFVDALRGNGA